MAKTVPKRKANRPGEIGSVIIRPSDSVANVPAAKRAKPISQTLTPRDRGTDFRANAPARPTVRPRGSMLGNYDIQSEEDWTGADGRVPQIDPTNTSNPAHPRTLRAGYLKERGAATGTLWVVFRDGTPWEYYDVPQQVWRNFRRVKSPGRFINRVLNNFDYGRGDF